MISARKIEHKRLVGVGVAMPDRLSRIDLPHRPTDYSVWDTVDVSSLFKGVVPGPVFIENDGTAAAMGELQFGHGLGQPSFFYLLINAGLGGGLIIEGTQYRGARGRSGEIGFLPLSAGATHMQNLGQVVSLSGLYEALRRGGYAVSRPEALENLDARGKALMDEWADTAAGLLVEPLIGVNCLLDPQVVFIGGRIPAQLVDRLSDRLNERLAEHAETIPTVAPVRRAAKAADAPAVGAALLPFTDRLLPTRASLMKTA
jgi:predicted NBD/HSP70 family sugar kinase